MARGRTADDEVLALLALTALPLARAEIAEKLGWEKSMASKVLLRLVTLHKVEILPGQANGAGRPCARYVLKVESTVEAPRPPAPIHFERDTVVITPSNREARVLVHRKDGYVELAYLDAPPGLNLTCVKATLLRVIQAGRDRPAPVRLTD